MNKKIFTALLVGVFAALVAISTPIVSNAQGGQLRYQNRYTKAQIGEIITRVEATSNEFRRDFAREMNNSPLNGTPAEGPYNRDVKAYEKSLNDLRKQFDRNASWWLVRNEVSDVINKAQPVNNIMNAISFRRNLERQWSAMRRDINTLADTFDLPGLAGGGWNGGVGGGWGDWGGSGNVSTPPSWAQGTFYSTNGTNITLNIDSTGHVWVVNQGQTFWGNYYRGNLSLNGDVSTVSQSGNGIRTYNRNTRQTTTYSRTSGGWGNNGGNNGGGWGGSGNMSTPPSWAQGTFYSTDGSNVSLSLNQNGQVTALVNGQTYFGTYYQGSITLNGDVSTVRRNGDGIRTYNTSSRQTTNYSRNDGGWGNNGGNNGGGWGGSGLMSAPPSWALGTFYSTDGSNITLSLNQNGQVTALVNGQTYFGTYYQGSITLNGDVSTVSRNGNGIRTYNTSNRQTTNYRR